MNYEGKTKTAGEKTDQLMLMKLSIPANYNATPIIK